MKQFIKNNLKVFVIVVITAILFTGIGVYAANTYLAHDISYTPSNENFDVNNVEDALNELYDKTEISIENIFTNAKKVSDLSEKTTISLELQKGKYLCIASQSFSSAVQSSERNIVNDEKIEENIVGCDYYQKINYEYNAISALEKQNTSAYAYLSANVESEIYYCDIENSKTISYNFLQTGNNMMPAYSSITCIKK